MAITVSTITLERTQWEKERERKLHKISLQHTLASVCFQHPNLVASFKAMSRQRQPTPSAQLHLAGKRWRISNYSQVRRGWNHERCHPQEPTPPPIPAEITAVWRASPWTVPKANPGGTFKTPAWNKLWIFLFQTASQTGWIVSQEPFLKGGKKWK